MKIFAIVTADEYEQPLAVCDTLGEIAKLTGRSKYDIPHTIRHNQVSQQPYNGHRYKIIRIDIDDEEDMEDGRSRKDPGDSQALHRR